MKIKNIYYLFSVKDKYFTDFSHVLYEENSNYHFFGLAYARNSFLQDGIYQHVSFISDILRKQTGSIDETFLVEIENKYGVNIATMIHADRHLMRFPKASRLYFAQEILRLFIHEMRQFNIDMVIAESVADLISYFAPFYCRFHQLNFFYTSYVGYGSRACLTSDIDSEPENFRQQFYDNRLAIKQGKIQPESVEGKLNRYILTKKKPAYLALGNTAYKIFKLDDLKTFLGYCSSYFRDTKGMHFDRQPLLTPLYRLRRILRKISYKKCMAKVGMKFSELSKTKYIIYPLHFEPEASTLIQGRWLNDQKKIIEILSKHVPADIKIIVKEHQPSIGRRPLRFYEDLLHYHNVFFVDDTMDSYQLIEHSIGVAVISSTMGLEALMLKKPVISFGERFYNISNNVYCIENYKQIHAVIMQMLNHHFDWEDTLAIFYTLFNLTKDLGCIAHLGYTKDDLKILANEVIQLHPVGTFTN